MVQLSEATRQCTDLCSQCANMCEATIAYCLEQGGRHAEATHLKLLSDCVEICRAADDYMLRGSEFAGRISTLCADICQRCAESCATFTNDVQMQACTEMCRRCADSCRSMSVM